jgi:mycothione reductase
MTGPERSSRWGCIPTTSIRCGVDDRPNSDRLDVAAAGLEVDAHGHVRTDATYATNVPGIWALGDFANHMQLKHMANAEARLVRCNLLHPGQPRQVDQVATDVLYIHPALTEVIEQALLQL